MTRLPAASSTETVKDGSVNQPSVDVGRPPKTSCAGAPGTTVRGTPSSGSTPAAATDASSVTVPGLIRVGANEANPSTVSADVVMSGWPAGTSPSRDRVTPVGVETGLPYRSSTTTVTGSGTPAVAEAGLAVNASLCGTSDVTEKSCDWAGTSEPSLAVSA